MNHQLKFQRLNQQLIKRVGTKTIIVKNVITKKNIETIKAKKDTKVTQKYQTLKIIAKKVTAVSKKSSN